MTLEDAFLQAILETPDDDLPRLAYADWLEERGDPRGEFINLQCRLARMDAEDDQRFDSEEREGELLRLHQNEWLGALGPMLRYWTFARGFLDTVQVPVAVYLAEGEIPRPATVRRLEVDLTGFEVPVPVAEFMPESVARENKILPLAFDQQTFVVAVREPQAAGLIAKLEFIFIRDVKAVAAPIEQIAAGIEQCYGPQTYEYFPPLDEEFGMTGRDDLAIFEDVERTPSAAPSRPSSSGSPAASG